MTGEAARAVSSRLVKSGQLKSGHLQSDVPMQLRLPRPLWFAFSAVVLDVVAVGLPFGIRAHQQWTAVEEISEFGGIEMDGITPVGPEWLRRWVGEERMLGFDEIQTLDFNGDIYRRKRNRNPLAWSGFATNGRVADDGVLGSVSKLRSLKHLRLAFTNITDAGIEHVARLPKLETLLLDGTDVSDNCIPFLKRLTNLKELSLHGTLVSEDGVKELERALPGLKVTR